MENKKTKILLQIDDKCIDFYNNTFKKNYKEEITFDLRILENSIYSLNLFNQISENKYKEIHELINEII